MRSQYRSRLTPLWFALAAFIMLPSLPASYVVAGLEPRDPQSGSAGVPLFNGRDLTGWHNINCAPTTFTAREGAIHSTGAPVCELRTDRMYENFVLDVDWMHLTPGGNAGIFIWAGALPARGQPFLRAIEVQVLDGRETANYTSHGDIFPIHGAKMTPNRPHPGGWDRSLPTEKRAKPAGQWNHYRITADRGRITLEVNGKAVSGGYDITPRKGYIALESEGAPAVFRNLVIRELPSAGTLSADQVAAEDGGFRSLYTGTNLDGWRIDGAADHFAPADWQFAAKGRSASDRASLVSTESFGDVEVFFDWRCGPPGVNEQPEPTAVTTDAEFEVSIAGVTDPRLKYSCATRVEGQQAGLDWNRTRISKRGATLEVELNDRKIAGGPAKGGAAPAPLMIAHRGDVVAFANVFVRTAAR